MITLKQLHYLLEVVRRGNITRAAASLNVAQTALGQQIRNLEETLGVALLRRHSRGVEPTPAGRLVLEEAEAIIARVEHLPRLVAAQAGRIPRPLALGITPSIQRLIGADIIMTAAERLPGFHLRVVEELSFVLFEALRRGEVDFAFAYEAEPASGVFRLPLLEEKLLFVEPPPAGPSPTISLAEALATDLALNGHRDGVWRLVRAAADRLALPLDPAFEVQSISAIKTLVARGVATSIMPYGVILAELQAGTLCSRMIDRPFLTRTLFLVCHEGDRALLADPAVAAFFAGLKSLLLERTGSLATPVDAV